MVGQLPASPNFPEAPGEAAPGQESSAVAAREAVPLMTPGIVNPAGAPLCVRPLNSGPSLRGPTASTARASISEAKPHKLGAGCRFTLLMYSDFLLTFGLRGEPQDKGPAQPMFIERSKGEVGRSYFPKGTFLEGLLPGSQERGGIRLINVECEMHAFQGVEGHNQ